ncbi:MAG: hypothetical protein OXH86_15175 [Acidimicrobiaceae bacterium]|nr:hypothetical protein [Acidimicrobiaceae bacterium]
MLKIYGLESAVAGATIGVRHSLDIYLDAICRIRSRATGAEHQRRQRADGTEHTAGAPAS